MALLRPEPELFVERFHRGGLRHGVRHIEIGGHATIGCCPALALDVGLARQSRLSEMHMIVDDTRNDVAARSIHLAVGTRWCLIAFDDVGNQTVFDEQVSPEGTPLVYQQRILNQCFHLYRISTQRRKDYGMKAVAMPYPLRPYEFVNPYSISW